MWIHTRKKICKALFQVLIMPLSHGIMGGFKFHFCLSGFSNFFSSFLNNVLGLDLTEAYLYNKHECKRQKKLVIVCHACRKSSASPGMFGVRGGCPLVAKATGPLQSLEGWRIRAWSFCRSQLAAWSAAPVWSECGCLASSLRQQRREES